MTKYEETITRKKKEHGSKFDTSNLAPQFIPFFNNGQRIEVTACGEVKRGYIGITTGWKPCFLLMLKSNSMGSSYILRTEDKILRTFNKYL